MRKLLAIALFVMAGWFLYHEGLSGSVSTYQSLPPQDNLAAPKIQFSAEYNPDGTQQLSHKAGW